MATRIKTKKAKSKTRKQTKAKSGKERRPDGLVAGLGRSKARRCDLLQDRRNSRRTEKNRWVEKLSSVRNEIGGAGQGSAAQGKGGPRGPVFRHPRLALPRRETAGRPRVSPGGVFLLAVTNDLSLAPPQPCARAAASRLGAQGYRGAPKNAS